MHPLLVVIACKRVNLLFIPLQGDGSVWRSDSSDIHTYTQKAPSMHTIHTPFGVTAVYVPNCPKLMHLTHDQTA
jgi:hypothetical protein